MHCLRAALQTPNAFWAVWASYALLLLLPLGLQCMCVCM